MKYLDEFRDAALVRELAARIRRDAVRPLRVMEVCGTHTMAIARFGIRSLLPEHITLISGPGCPVCVTPQAQIDRFISLGAARELILTSFGDMLRVPGSDGSLEVARARGADVRPVYSPLDALQLAREYPHKRVVFFAVGFETTIPAVALALLEARQDGIDNFFILCAHKLVPPALHALAADPDINLHGLLCPGHVSVILGSAVYEPLARDFGLACVIAGFEPLDILQAVHMLVMQVGEGCAEVETQYARAVRREGNTAALKAIADVFTPVDAEWRGLGVIPASGLRLRPEFAAFDAEQFLPAAVPHSAPPSPCACGQILTGRLSPADCPAFGRACTPESPLGPCMVSSEGACAAAYRYSRTDE